MRNIKKVFIIVLAVVFLFFGQIFFYGLSGKKEAEKQKLRYEASLQEEVIQPKEISSDEIISGINLGRDAKHQLVENDCLNSKAQERAEYIAENGTDEEKEKDFDYEKAILECFDAYKASASTRMVVSDVKDVEILSSYIKEHYQKAISEKYFKQIGASCSIEKDGTANSCVVLFFGYV